MIGKRIFLCIFIVFLFKISSYSQTSWTVTQGADDGPGSFRNIISLAQTGDTIYFSDEVDTVFLTSGELLIGKSLVIIGSPGRTNIKRANAGQKFRIIRIQAVDSIQVQFRNITVMNGNAPDGNSTNINGQHGGGIFVPDSIHHIIFQDCSILNNKSGNGFRKSGLNTTGNGGSGGGIYSLSRLGFFNSVISENLSGSGAEALSGYFTGQNAGPGGSGGGIYCLNDLTLEYCIMENNHAGPGGEAEGGLYSYGGDGGKGGSGGAIFFSNGSIVLRNSVLKFNSAGKAGSAFNSQTNCGAGLAGSGGGIHCASSEVLITDCEFTGNYTQNGGSAGGNEYGSGTDGGPGGGIFAVNAILNLQRCVFTDNHTGNGGSSGNYSQYGWGNNGGNGGGLAVQDGSLLMDECHINENYTGSGRGFYPYLISDGHGGSGGGMFVKGAGIGSRVTNCRFENNLTGNGGTYYQLLDNTNFAVANGGNGGALADKDSWVEYVNCLFYGNRCGNAVFKANIPPGGDYSLPRGGSGGAIHFNQPDRALINCTLAGNHAGFAVIVPEPEVSPVSSTDSIRGRGGAIFAESQRIKAINSIIAYNYINDSVFNDLEGPWIMQYSLLSTDTLSTGDPGNGNLVNFDPGFISFPDDLHLSPNSPAINHGIPDTSGLFIPGTDIDGNPRIIGNRIDMGAFEFQGEPGNQYYINTEVIYLDSVYQGSFATDSLIIYNLGPAALMVSDIHTSGSFSLSLDKINWSAAIPELYIPTGEPYATLKLFVKFEPLTPGLHSSQIFIIIGDSISELPVSGYCKSPEGIMENIIITGLVIAPNPMSRETTISFILANSSDVQIIIANSFGKIVEVITMTGLSQGRHSINWDGSDLTSGTYHVLFRVGTVTLARKVIIL